MYDVEIKYGLLQISEGLTFIHNSAKMLHRNISPESILINEQGAEEEEIIKIKYFDCLLSLQVPGRWQGLSIVWLV